jgi:hypothetical protein
LLAVVHNVKTLERPAATPSGNRSQSTEHHQEYILHGHHSEAMVTFAAIRIMLHRPGHPKTESESYGGNWVMTG